jgi:tetratricopeptide (TPR) repeat protein/O-antigen ligase
LARSTALEETGAARFAEGLLEAGWLLALLVTPSFFDFYSGHPFEPDKAMVVRLLALVMAAAGLAIALPAWRSWRWPRGAPLLWPVLFYLGAAALSTFLSLDPRLSLWGSYFRGEGLVTLAAYLVVFVALAARLRRRAQRDRLVDVVVAGSVPVTLYGLMQAAGLELMDWQLTHQEWRVSSTLGNPIFAGSYLILSLPLTLAALVEWRARPGSTGVGWRYTRLALYATAAALQVSVLALTGSRGPWLGGAAALVAFVLLVAALGRRRRLAAAVLALSVAGVAFVALLNVPGGPLERARQTRLMGRLGHVLDPEGRRNPGDRARVRVWEGALALARPRPPLALPEGEDPRAPLRPLIGYGPETLQVAFGAVYDAEFARLERRNPEVSDYGVSTFSTRIPDRSHNELLDSLVAGGLLGAAAHLVLAAAIQALGLRAMGLLATRKDGLRLAAFGLAGGVLGTLLAALTPSWGFAAVGLPLGLVGGWTAYVLGCAFRRGDGAAAPASPLQLAVLAALVGHFVEIHFGPAVTTARLYFWALTGVLLALSGPRDGDRAAESGAAEAPPASPPLWKALAGGIPAGLLGAALGATLLFDFVNASGRTPNPVTSALAVVTQGSAAPRTMMLAGMVSVLVLVVLEVGRRSGPRGPAVAAGLLMAAALTLGFAALHLGALQRTGEARKVADVAWSVGGVFTRYILWLLALAALLAASLARRGTRAPRARAVVAALRTAALLAVALAVGLPPALASVGADIMARFAAGLQAKGFVGDALAIFDGAAAEAPWDPAGLRSQGEAYLTATRRTGSPVRRQEYLRRAETAFARARVLDPLSPDNHANLARLARWRADISRDPATAGRAADEAGRHFAAAARLVPANTLLLNEWAELDFTRRRDFAGAEEKLQRSLRLDPSFDYTYAALGDMHMARAGAAVGDPAEDYRRAAAAYAQAWERRPSVKAMVSMALAHERLGEKQQAVGAYNQALAMNPPAPTASAIHEQLGGLYLALGDRVEAERQAQLALWRSQDRDKTVLLQRLRAAGLIPG